MSLSGTMVRILTDDNYFHLIEWAKIKSVEYEQQLKDFNHLTFNVDRYIDVDGEYVESTGYEKLKDHMTIYLEGLDYFQLQEPSLQNDNGRYEYKACEAYSDEKPLKIRI